VTIFVDFLLGGLEHGELDTRGLHDERVEGTARANGERLVSTAPPLSILEAHLLERVIVLGWCGDDGD